MNNGLNMQIVQILCEECYGEFNLGFLSNHKDHSSVYGTISIINNHNFMQENFMSMKEVHLKFLQAMKRLM